MNDVVAGVLVVSWIVLGLKLLFGFLFGLVKRGVRHVR